MPVRRRRAFDWSAAVIAVLAVTSAALVYLRDGQARFLAILTDDLGLFGIMLPKVLAGCLIGAFVTLLLPRETIARWVGAESGHRRHPGRDASRARSCRADRSPSIRSRARCSPPAPTRARPAPS